MARPLLVLCTLLLCAAPLHAQNRDHLATGCTRSRPLRGDDAERDSVQRAIRKAVRDDALAAARAAGVAEPAGLFVILFDRRNPGTGSFRSYHSNVPAAVLQGVFDRAATPLMEWPQRGDAALNVRLDADGEVAPPSEAETMECAPQLENRAEVARLVQQFAEQEAETSPHKGRMTAELTMLLSREGEVVYADVERSSGDPRLDAFAVSLAQRLRLRVGTVDGKPVDSWVSFPISTETRSSTPRRP